MVTNLTLRALTLIALVGLTVPGIMPAASAATLERSQRSSSS